MYMQKPDVFAYALCKNKRRARHSDENLFFNLLAYINKQLKNAITPPSLAAFCDQFNQCL